MTFKSFVLGQISGNVRGFAGLVLGLSCSVPAFAQDAVVSPKEIVAVEVRKAGYACDTPESATRDTKASKPDNAVWVLKCDTGSYRVVLHEDEAASVEILD